MLSFEGAAVLGAKNIVEKLVSLPFQKVQHRISTLDSQPTGPGTSGVVVMVTGELLVDEEQNPQRYSQLFHLVGDGGNFYVLNVGQKDKTFAKGAGYISTCLRIGTV